MLIHAPPEPFKVVPGWLRPEASLYLSSHFPWGPPFSSSNTASQLLPPAQWSLHVFQFVHGCSFHSFDQCEPVGLLLGTFFLYHLLSKGTNFKSLHLVGFLQGLSQGLAHTWLSLFIELCESMKVVDGWITYSTRRKKVSSFHLLTLK